VTNPNKKGRLPAMRKLVFAAILLMFPVSAFATVTTTSKSIDFTGTGTPASSFTFPYPILDTTHLVVTKYTGSCGSATYTVLTLNSSGAAGYTVTKVNGGKTSTVATVTALSTGYCLRIERVVPVTQATSFRTQGTFNPKSHEDALDKLTMIAQQLGLAGTSLDCAACTATHVATSDPHTGYLLLAGRSGGQTAYGGTAVSENLVLKSTSNAGAKGHVTLAGFADFSEHASIFALTGAQTISGTLGVTGTFTASGKSTLTGTVTTAEDIKVGTDIIVSGAAVIGTTLLVAGTSSLVGNSSFAGNLTMEGTLYGGTTTGQDLILHSTSHSTKGKIYFGASSAYSDSATASLVKLGLNTTSPSYMLHVVGDGYFSTNLYVGTALTFTGPGIVYGSVSSGGDLYLLSTTHGTKGNIIFSDYANIEETTGAIAGPRKSINVGNAYTAELTNVGSRGASECGAWFHTSNDNAILTLPETGSGPAGCQITLSNTANVGAAKVSVSIDDGDNIVGTCQASSGKAWTALTIEGVDLVNPKASHTQGDYVTLISDGASTWWIVGCMGGWDEEV
jgi:hypothetical protein